MRVYRRWKKFVLWRGLGLHQQSDQDGVRRGRWKLRRRLPEPEIPAQGVRQCFSHQNREEGLRPPRRRRLAS